MQSKVNLTFETLEKQAGFALTTPTSNVVDVIFEDAPQDYYVGTTPHALILMVSSSIRATAFSSGDNEESIDLVLNKPSMVPESFSLKFENCSNIEIKDDNNLILNLDTSKIHVEMIDCLIANDEQNSATILMSGQDAKIIFSSQSIVSSKSIQKNVTIQSVDSGRLLIQANKRIPEFIISIYDDASFHRPRPSRFGVPIISTVPGFIPDSSWSVNVPVADTDLMELGVGTEQRTMYFRVISDQTIDSSIRSSLRLEIDLPLGIDIVGERVSVPLVYNSTSTGSADTNDVFDGNYNFHKEDTVNFIDGFAYLSVKLPLRIQRNLPLLFQVTTDGVTFTNNSTIGDAMIVDELSIKEKAVQSITANSEQGSKASTGNNKKSGRKPKT